MIEVLKTCGIVAGMILTVAIPGAMFCWLAAKKKPEPPTTSSGVLHPPYTGGI